LLGVSKLFSPRSVPAGKSRKLGVLKDLIYGSSYLLSRPDFLNLGLMMPGE
jgi:hypothetical protein